MITSVLGAVTELCSNDGLVLSECVTRDWQREKRQCKRMDRPRPERMVDGLEREVERSRPEALYLYVSTRAEVVP
jgi:hypothetical protein